MLCKLVKPSESLETQDAPCQWNVHHYILERPATFHPESAEVQTRIWGTVSQIWWVYFIMWKPNTALKLNLPIKQCLMYPVECDEVKANSNHLRTPSHISHYDGWLFEKCGCCGGQSAGINIFNSTGVLCAAQVYPVLLGTDLGDLVDSVSCQSCAGDVL